MVCVVCTHRVNTLLAWEKEVISNQAIKELSILTWNMSQSNYMNSPRKTVIHMGRPSLSHGSPITTIDFIFLPKLLVLI